MADPLILQVNDLCAEFHTREGIVRAVDGVSFSLPRGRTLGIVGESGSGKSVTALSIMRLLAAPGRIAGGQCLFTQGGHTSDVFQLPEKQMQGLRGNEIAMIFQEPMSSLNPVFTCGYQVAEALRLHKGMTKQQARVATIELFQKVELPRPDQMYEAYPHQLSGGQKQRVMIAMAISCDPAVLIADEPTTALDVTVQQGILELLQQLQREHQMSVLFITHDLGVVGEIADDILVMYRGKVVESGPVEAIFSAPSHPYTQGLLACRPSMGRKMRRLPTVADFLSGKSDASVSQEVFQPQEPKTTHPRALMEVKELYTWFPGGRSFFGKEKEPVKAVDGVSFQVFEGETLGLVGESGCGKTTLGRTMLRLIEPTRGDIYYEGRSLTGLEKKPMRQLRKDLQIIFQDPYSSLNPRIPVGEAIEEPMRVHGLYGNARAQREKVEELLSKVELSPDHYQRYPHEFSGGQRQRICIARALALNPRFVICDESVSALDVSIQAQVLNLLKDLQEEFGFTYVFISHDLSVVKFMSDRLMVMKEGKIVESGDAVAVYENPQSPYTQKLINAIPKGTLESIGAAIQRRRG